MTPGDVEYVSDAELAQRCASVTRLVPNPVRDVEAAGKAIAKLAADHAKGDVVELLYVYLDAQQRYTFAIGPNMTLSHLALAIAYLQESLNRYIAARPDREPPEPIA